MSSQSPLLRNFKRKCAQKIAYLCAPRRSRGRAKSGAPLFDVSVSTHNL